MTYKFIMALLTLALLGACSASDQSNRVVGELASERIEIAAESNEPIVEIAATEGQAVTVGQVLVRQDATRATAHLAQAEAALGQQQARLDELVRGPRSEQIAAARASVEGAAQELAFRNSELVRIREVHKKGLASTELLDAARAALDAAKANDKVARAQLEELLAGTTIEELSTSRAGGKTGSGAPRSSGCRSRPANAEVARRRHCRQSTVRNWRTPGPGTTRDDRARRQAALCARLRARGSARPHCCPAPRP